MRTQKKQKKHTYKTAKRKAAIRSKNSRRFGRFYFKCVICTFAFTFTMLATAKWNMVKPQSGNYSGSRIHKEHTDYELYGSYEDIQLQFSASNHSNEIPSDTIQERLPAEQLIDTTVDDAASPHITQSCELWNLILVNPWNKMPDDYEISLTPLPNGHSIDSRCYPALTEMMNACHDAGLHPVICSSYRSMEKQKALFQERIDELLAQGYSKKAARKKAATSVARPGTSEHQIGLAVDIVDKNHQMLDTMQEYTPVQQWLIENSWKYGFILRYPNNKSKLTGIIYEPWHYRYVGLEAAQEIYERGICLEEYLS